MTTRSSTYRSSSDRRPKRPISPLDSETTSTASSSTWSFSTACSSINTDSNSEVANHTDTKYSPQTNDLPGSRSGRHRCVTSSSVSVSGSESSSGGSSTSNEPSRHYSIVEASVSATNIRPGSSFIEQFGRKLSNPISSASSSSNNIPEWTIVGTDLCKDYLYVLYENEKGEQCGKMYPGTVRKRIL